MRATNDPWEAYSSNPIVETYPVRMDSGAPVGVLVITRTEDLIYVGIDITPDVQ